jgi:integrase/recombinase XerD
VHVAAYVETLQARLAAPSVKQHLAAIRMLFDWLVVGQIVPHNPAAPVRGPKHVVRKGKTPVLIGEEARQLLDAIRTDTVVGLRDRAFIGTLIYSFARVGAACTLDVDDVYHQGRRTWLRLHEKGGKRHDMPAHHELEVFLDTYMTAAGIAEAKGAPLFRTAVGKTGVLSERRLGRHNAYHMVQRRARDAGIATRIGCHTFRATGITAYLENGGTLEKAQLMAAHESPRTTKLYDRTNDQVTLDEVERIAIR